MELNERQKHIVFGAWLLARKGHGHVITDEAIPDAHELCEAGWLERRIEQNGDVSWWWSRRAEAALDLASLIERGCQN